MKQFGKGKCVSKDTVKKRYDIPVLLIASHGFYEDLEYVKSGCNVHKINTTKCGVPSRYFGCLSSHMEKIIMDSFKETDWNKSTKFIADKIHYHQYHVCTEDDSYEEIDLEDVKQSLNEYTKEELDEVSQDTSLSSSEKLLRKQKIVKEHTEYVHELLNKNLYKVSSWKKNEKYLDKIYELRKDDKLQDGIDNDMTRRVILFTADGKKQDLLPSWNKSADKEPWDALDLDSDEEMGGENEVTVFRISLSTLLSKLNENMGFQNVIIIDMTCNTVPETFDEATKAKMDKSFRGGGKRTKYKTRKFKKKILKKTYKTYRRQKNKVHI